MAPSCTIWLPVIFFHTARKSGRSVPLETKSFPCFYCAFHVLHTSKAIREGSFYVAFFFSFCVLFTAYCYFCLVFTEQNAFYLFFAFYCVFTITSFSYIFIHLSKVFPSFPCGVVLCTVLTLFIFPHRYLLQLHYLG